MTIINKVIETLKEYEVEFLSARLLDVDEAKALLSEEDRRYNDWWWLCSLGADQFDVAFVGYNGSVDEDGGSVNYADVTVRPVLVMSENDSLEIGDIFYIGKYKFKVISNTLAWLYDSDIGYHYFDEKTNNYETSEVKEFINNWFKNEIIGK